MRQCRYLAGLEFARKERLFELAICLYEGEIWSSFKIVRNVAKVFWRLLLGGRQVGRRTWGHGMKGEVKLSTLGTAQSFSSF
jgi:hypothetical protein